MRIYYEVLDLREDKSIKQCVIEDCKGRYFGKGYCTKHYQRMRFNRSLQTKLPVDLSLEERFWQKVSKGSPDSCWLWTGRKDRKGYGCLDFKRNTPAHRISYELFVREIPANLTLDHLCRNPACVNFLHLEPVTVSENSNRMHEWRKWVAEWRDETLEKTFIHLGSRRE